MSENTTTGGLVEELRALHVRVETPMFGGVERSCRGCGQDWPCDTTSLLDAHASRTAEATCSHTWPCPVHSPASSSPEPGAVGVLARTRAALRREIGLPSGDREREWQPMVSAAEVRQLLDALDIYLSPADVGRVVAAAKAEAQAELLAKPCGSCHPCTEWAAETWRRTGGRLPTKIEVDSMVTRLKLVREALLQGGQTAAIRWREAVRILEMGPWEFVDTYADRFPQNAERRTEPDEAVSADD